MLKKVLQALANGNVHSQADLANQLNVSEGLLVQMMKDLARKGYLVPLDTGASSGCATCKASCSSCSAHKIALPQGWELTAKGLGAVRKNRAA